MKKMGYLFFAVMLVFLLQCTLAVFIRKHRQLARKALRVPRGHQDQSDRLDRPDQLAHKDQRDHKDRLEWLQRTT